MGNCFDCGLPIGDMAYVQMRVGLRMVRKHESGECRIAVDRALAGVEAERDLYSNIPTEVAGLLGLAKGWAAADIYRAIVDLQAAQRVCQNLASWIYDKKPGDYGVSLDVAAELDEWRQVAQSE
jgi:hypothetical protein